MARQLTLISLIGTAVGISLIATPALASAPHTGASTQTVVIATAKGNTVLATSGNAVTCSNSSLALDMNAAGDAADITAGTWTGCNFSGSFPATVTTTAPDWQLDITNSTLSDVDLHIDIALGTTHCAYDIGGNVPITFLTNNGKGGQELDLTGAAGLTVSNVNSPIACLGLIDDGAAATVDGQYNLPV